MTASHDTSRPSARTVLGSPVHLVAFGFGSGLAPNAPGTSGTLVGILLWWALGGLPPVPYFGAVLALFLLGCWVCGRSAELLGVHDYGGIVFDEIVGYLIAAAPLLPGLRPTGGGGLLGVVAAFVLFRIFDIVKPWPIRALDRRVGGGLGIMIDDVVAGLFAAAVLVGLETVLRTYAVL